MSTSSPFQTTGVVLLAATVVCGALAGAIIMPMVTLKGAPVGNETTISADGRPPAYSHAATTPSANVHAQLRPTPVTPVGGTQPFAVQYSDTDVAPGHDVPAGNRAQGAATAVTPDRMPSGSVYAPVTVRVDGSALVSEMRQMGQRYDRLLEERKSKDQQPSPLPQQRVLPQVDAIQAEKESRRDQQLADIAAGLRQLTQSFHDLKQETRDSLSEISERASHNEVTSADLDTLQKALEEGLRAQEAAARTMVVSRRLEGILDPVEPEPTSADDSGVTAETFEPLPPAPAEDRAESEQTNNPFAPDAPADEEPLPPAVGAPEPVSEPPFTQTAPPVHELAPVIDHSSDALLPPAMLHSDDCGESILPFPMEIGPPMELTPSPAPAPAPAPAPEPVPEKHVSTSNNAVRTSRVPKLVPFDADSSYKPKGIGGLGLDLGAEEEIIADPNDYHRLPPIQIPGGNSGTPEPSSSVPITPRQFRPEMDSASFSKEHPQALPAARPASGRPATKPDAVASSIGFENEYRFKLADIEDVPTASATASAKTHYCGKCGKRHQGAGHKHGKIRQTSQTTESVVREESPATAARPARTKSASTSVRKPSNATAERRDSRVHKSGQASKAKRYIPSLKLPSMPKMPKLPSFTKKKKSEEPSMLHRLGSSIRRFGKRTPTVD